MDKYGDVSVVVNTNEHVATVEIHRPPNNYFDDALIRNLADAFETLDKDQACRAILLAAEGKSFCAGANFQSRPETNPLNQSQTASGSNPLYLEAVRLFRATKPSSRRSRERPSVADSAWPWSQTFASPPRRRVSPVIS